MRTQYLAPNLADGVILLILRSVWRELMPGGLVRLNIKDSSPTTARSVMVPEALSTVRIRHRLALVWSGFNTGQNHALYVKN
jgi:hypothetical protein